MLKHLRMAAMPVISALVAVLSLPAQAQSNKSVTIVAGEEPEDLDQCSATSSQAAARILQQNVYESLIELRPDGTFAPRLATSWEQVNDLTWRFHIRQGVTFHDGAKLNADAVVLALNRVVGAKFRCQIKIKYFSDVKVGAEKVDEYTVDFRTETPAPIMPVYASGLVVPSPNTPFDKLQLTASGTGPYVLEKWVQQQEITAKRNPNYWDKGKKLEVEAVRYIFRKDTAVQAAMVANGEADMAGGISVLDANNPKTDVAYPNAETSYLRIDSQVPPLDDIRIRKALNYAIDRQAMMGPIFPRGSVLATQVWGPNIAGHNFEIDKKVWPYDPAKARQLIAEAKAAGVKVDTEIELQGRIDVYPNAQELMEAAYQYYKNVGLNVKLKMYEVGTWRQLNNRPFPENRGPGLLQASHDNATGDPAISAPNRHGCTGGASAFCDPLVDKMINEAAQSKGEQRVRAYQELARYLHEDAVANVFLIHMVSFARVNPRIKYTPNALSNVMVKLEDITFN